MLLFIFCLEQFMSYRSLDCGKEEPVLVMVDMFLQKFCEVAGRILLFDIVTFFSDHHAGRNVLQQIYCGRETSSF